MNKWKVEIILKSGKELTAYCTTEHDNSTKVAEMLIAGNQNETIGLNDKEKTKHIVIKKDEIAAIAISIA